MLKDIENVHGRHLEHRKIPHRKYLDFRKQHGQSWSREKLNAENFTFKN